MPRFFFDIYNDVISLDEDGVELDDLEAVRTQVRRTLPELIKEIGPSQDAAQFRVDVRDSKGDRVVTSTILMVMQRVDPGRTDRSAVKAVQSRLGRPGSDSH